MKRLENDDCIAKMIGCPAEFGTKYQFSWLYFLKILFPNDTQRDL